MFSMTDEQAWEAHKRGEISLGEYMSVRDTIKKQNEAQADLYAKEQTALKVEEALEKLGGRKTARGYGELPAVFGSNGNLTNQMALAAAAKKGDKEAIELTKFLSQQAGQVIPSTLLADLDRAIEREQQHARIREQTTALSQANDRLTGHDRNAPEAFPWAGETMRARSAGSIPYFGGKGA